MSPFLYPVREKYKLQDLQRAGNAYLSKTEKFKLPSPNRSLELIVVIPVYNEEKELPQVLECLQAQTINKNRFEIIAVDNNSTDKSASVIKQFAFTHHLPIYVIQEQQRGCLYAVRKGMEWAIARLAQHKIPGGGAVAAIDADDYIEPHWAETMLNCLLQSRSDMVRGPVIPKIKYQISQKQRPPQIFNVENHVQAYINLVRSHLPSMLNGLAFTLRPWLPRITGSNIILHATAYIAIGGLNPTPPGDQASKLGGPLLQLGFPVHHCNNLKAAVYRSPRSSQRNYKQAGGFGVGFGPGYAECLSITTRKHSYRYPNPEWLELGFEKIRKDLANRDSIEQEMAKRWAMDYLARPPDPNPLYRLGQNVEMTPYVSLDFAEKVLPGMIARLDGIDYRSYELFLFARELIRQRLLLEEEMVNSEAFVTKLIQFFEINKNDPPQTHVVKALAEIKQIPLLPRQSWFKHCSSILETIYKELPVEYHHRT